MASHKDSIRAICLPNGSSNYQPVIWFLYFLCLFQNIKEQNRNIFNIFFIANVLCLYLPSDSINWEHVIWLRSSKWPQYNTTLTDEDNCKSFILHNDIASDTYCFVLLCVLLYRLHKYTIRDAGGTATQTAILLNTAQHCSHCLHCF